MKFTVRQLADLVGGNLIGDGDLTIQSARTLQEAQPGDITFVENKTYATQLQQSGASAAVVPANWPRNGKALIEVADPLTAFVAIVQHMQGKVAAEPTGIDPRAAVHPSAKIGAAPSIAPFAGVGENTIIGRRCRLHQGVAIGKNCRLGDDVTLHPHVVLYDDTVLGDRVVIHANASIGADGFGYRLEQGRHVKVPHLSNVIIGCDVEIGACTTIDRGAFQPTIIDDGTKIDNLVQIGHNCKIGKHNVFAAQSGIAGSCTTGSFVMLGGQVGVRDHINIGDNVMLGAQSGVIEDVPAGERLFGTPACEVKLRMRIITTELALPQMRRDLARIMKRLGMNDKEPGERPALAG